ncbi:TetR/AcrR family transcriptional regulator [Streptomyces sp. NPDC059271]|uniref:TetR/AcrR family transcriptional regulator n=1 Tax=Streptomyces sp. NPDC059271 TaxID=3346799 RepID=UPI00367F2F3E
MSRVSKAQAEANRASVVTAASQLFRQRGIQGVSVADLMKAVGLTHGGFYKQFESKDSLVTEATAQAFVDRGVYLAGLEENSSTRAQARRDLVEEYLSPEHRDDPGTGCPSAGFASDLAHAALEGNTMPQKPYADGVRAFADWMSDEEGDEGLVATCTMVGAILLARATSSTDLSEEILDAARKAVGSSLA